MYSAEYVEQKIKEIKQSGKILADQVWEAALLCVGWPYIFGDRGQYCTPSHRESKNLGKYPTIRTKCQVLNGSKASCSGCKWYPGGKKVRAFDCRGYTYWCLLEFGIKIMGTGATTQWNDDSNWAEKGTIDSIPDDKLVCLFYPDKDNTKVMAHTGFGYHGETLECSNGVQHFTTRNKKWTYWAIPKGLYEGVSPITQPYDPSDVELPTLRKGDKGTYVSLLQSLLINRGYALSKYGADGSFGNETLAAVRQFQQDWGLAVDGVVGKKTWDQLESSPERKILYTVTIPHISKEMADDLLSKYAGTMQQES